MVDPGGPPNYYMKWGILISDFLFYEGFTEDELQDLHVRYMRKRDHKWRAIYGLDQDMQDTLKHGLYINGPLKGQQVFIYYKRGDIFG